MATEQQRQVFARSLHRALAAQRMSQRDLARAVDVSPNAVSQWVKGDTAPRTLEVAEKVERALGLQEGDLSRLIGFSPRSVQERAMVNVLTAIEADPRLDEPGRHLLMSIRQELGRRHEAEVAYAALRAAAERITAILPNGLEGISPEAAEALDELRRALQTTPLSRSPDQASDTARDASSSSDPDQPQKNM
ncbi:MAG TPA: helix-turn-helix transcriptional regulator [Streptosporangiaceae bacterium]